MSTNWRILRLVPDILLALVPLLNENCESESCELKDAAFCLGGNDMCGSLNVGNDGDCDGNCDDDCGNCDGTCGNCDGKCGNCDGTGAGDFDGTGGNSENTRAGVPEGLGLEVGDISVGFFGTLGNCLRFAGILMARGFGVCVTNLASRPFLNTGSSGGRSLMLSWPP